MRVAREITGLSALVEKNYLHDTKGFGSNEVITWSHFLHWEAVLEDVKLDDSMSFDTMTSHIGSKFE